jgi:PAS domain S-box-containing protein/putative nucleotidyltransferase with HDIG domain
MGTQLRILIVEDSESDAGLIVRRLQQADYDLVYKRVETAEAMSTALETQDWDIVISAYQMSRFSAPAAQETLRGSTQDLPFIIVSGTVGEEKAVAMLKAGAHDYVMKDNLARLVPAVARELREAEGRRERRCAEDALIKSEATLRTVLKGSPSGIGLVIHRVFQWVNDQLLSMTGYSREDLLGHSTRILYASETEYKRVGHVTLAQIKANGWGEVETQWQQKDGNRMEVYVSTVAVDPNDLSAGVVFTIKDITVRKRTEGALQFSLRIFEMVHEQTEIKPLLEAFVAEIINFTGCEAVGIRVLDTTGRIPYLAYQGFRRQFYEIENPLSIHADQCMCINVIKGTCDPKLPFYTPGGSFYMNGTTRFLATVSEEDKGSTRNACNQEGYESVALIPFRRGDRILGLIQVSDHREDMVPLHIVEMLEKVGMQLGTAFQKLQAEKELRESEERYRTLVENIDLGISLISSDYRIIMTNPAGGKFFHKASGEFAGRECFREFEKRDAVCSHCPGTKAMATGMKEVLETTGIRDDGSQFDARIYAFPHRNPDGTIIGFVEVVEDITAQKQMQEALRESEQLYRSLFENMLNGFAYYKMLFNQGQSQDFIFLNVNRSFEVLTGLKDVIGKKVSEVIPGLQESNPELLETYGRVALTGKPERFEIYVEALQAWFFFSVYSPAKEYFVTVFDVITERKLAEVALRENEERFRHISSTISDISYSCATAQDGFYELDWMTGAGESITGYSLEEIKTQRCWGFLVIEADRELFNKHVKGLAPGSSGSCELRLRHKNGGIVWVASFAECVKIPGHPEINRLYGGLVDITKRKLADEELQVAAQKWQTTFNAIGDAVCLLDRECKIQQCNQAMANLLGKSFSEIIGRHCWEVVHKTTGPIEKCPVRRLRESRRRETQTLLFGDRWLHVIVDPIVDEAGEVTGAVHIIADITEQQRATEKIHDLNAFLSAIKDINETLLRVKSEPELFQQICGLMLKVPYNRFTWIGLVERGSFKVKPVAWAGHEDGYLSIIKVTWDDSPHGRGPIGTAIKTGQPGIVEDIENDPHFRLWAKEAQQRGYASFVAFPLIHEGITLGSLNVYAEKKNAFGVEELGFLKQVAGDIAVGVRSLRLEQELIQSLIKLQVVMLQTVEAITSMVELRDPYTAGHQRGVTRLALALAREMGLADERLEGIRVAGFLHDIGKIAVPAEILNKPGKINEYEMDIIRTHPQVGYDILKKIDFPWPVAQIVLQHHERLNGSGYPEGLTGENILLEARILAVADVVEAMAAHRPYRPALGIDKALEEIKAQQGVLYDSEAVAACIKLFVEQAFELA